MHKTLNEHKPQSSSNGFGSCWEISLHCCSYVSKLGVQITLLTLCWKVLTESNNSQIQRNACFSYFLPLAVRCVEIVSVLQHAGSWPPVPRENQVPQETCLHAPPLGPGILQNLKKQNALCTTWYVHVIPASWWGFISNVYFQKHSICTGVLYYLLMRIYQWCILSKTLHSYWSSLLHSFRTLKFLPICGGGCPFFGAGGGGWGGTRYTANSWDLDMMKMWFAN